MTENASLAHCIYASTAETPLSGEALNSLLKTAREKNAAQDITGILLYDEGAFFQVLEGPADGVAALFRKITLDRRHHKIVKLISEPIEYRSFEGWSMGHAELRASELCEIEGMNDFFQSGKCFIDLDEGRAKQLLRAFADGKWRSSIHE